MTTIAAVPLAEVRHYRTRSRWRRAGRGLGLALASALFRIAELINFWSQDIQLTTPVVTLGAALALLLAVASAVLPSWRGLRLAAARAMAAGG